MCVSSTGSVWYDVRIVNPPIQFQASLLSIGSCKIEDLSIGTNSETPGNVVARAAAGAGDNCASQRFQLLLRKNVLGR